MKIGDVEYIKVRDPKAGETGWAYLTKDGRIILDNDFERISRGSTLILDEDDYTIVDFEK